MTQTESADAGTLATTKAEMLKWLRQMYEIRFFEEQVYDLLGRNVIRGASHLYAGQEAVAVGAISVIADQDVITSTHRGHGHCHALGDTRAESPAARQDHLNRMMAELFGKATGYCRGRGGSMHIADVEKGNLGATGIVGGNIPVAVGAGLAAQRSGRHQVVLSFFGDGASNTGNFHEALNMVATWNLPVVYICENNLYAMSVPFSKASKLQDISARAAAYGIPGVSVDGMDVFAVREAVAAAVERARSGEGPTLIECKTYRWYGHSRSDARVYRTREEEKAWHDRDPITNLSRELLARGIATEAEIAEVEAGAKAAVEESVRFAMESPDPPATQEELYDGVCAPAKTTQADVAAEAELRRRIAADPSVRQIAYWQAINEALAEEMERDPSVFLLGEDIGLYGGAYGATRGLLERFGPERVMDTPISEATIAGAAVGAAMSGLRPVSEIMYVDFTPLAMDQLANQGAKNRYMFGGKTRVPLVCRTEGGAGRGIAAHHSQSLEALWIHFPGIYVVMPATPYDAKGLLKAAIRDDNPVMFIEHKMLYGNKGPVPEGEYVIPLGVADVKREGTDATIVTYSRMVYVALQAAEVLAKEHGISVEVLDLRTLKPMDTEAIVRSVRKTKHLLTLSEGYKTGGVGSEIMAVVNDLAFDYLDGPMVRLGAADVPVPCAKTLEDLAVQLLIMLRTIFIIQNFRHFRHQVHAMGIICSSKEILRYLIFKIQPIPIAGSRANEIGRLLLQISHVPLDGVPVPLDDSPVTVKLIQEIRDNDSCIGPPMSTGYILQRGSTVCIGSAGKLAVR